jgi:predicted ATPase
MNEQLIVKNFGPITDATVDFKRVTVFIGPTGGGKSTLAKLAAIAREGKFYLAFNEQETKAFYQLYNIESFFKNNTSLRWEVNNSGFETQSINELPKVFFDIIEIDELAASYLREITLHIKQSNTFIRKQTELHKEFVNKIKNREPDLDEFRVKYNAELASIQQEIQVLDNLVEFKEREYSLFFSNANCTYVPAERIFISAISSSWAGLIRDDIGLPKTLLNFANSFSQARDLVVALPINFLGADYFKDEDKDYLTVIGSNHNIRLSEAASGLQSVTPMLVLLEHLSRNTEQAQSFIIEEPELNLYPTAQRDLVYWLLEKCTHGDNDLTITTHSPYVLSALNLALYAGKVATLFPHQRQKVAKIIPEKYWLKADEFSAYHVAGGGVKSIFDTKTGLLSESQLDEVSGHFADVFDRLTDLRVPEKKAPAKAKPAKK